MRSSRTPESQYERPVLKVLDRLQATQWIRRGQWTAQCPAHRDEERNLSISETDDGKVLIHCRRGCNWREILDAMDLPASALFPQRPGRRLRWDEDD
jgi:hypothetical protein